VLREKEDMEMSRVVKEGLGETLQLKMVRKHQGASLPNAAIQYKLVVVGVQINNVFVS
jgi:hypothetical protein